MTSSAADPLEVVVGVVGRAHGLRGDVAVELRTDSPELRFAPGVVLRGEGSGRSLTVAARREASGRLLVRFAEIADRTAAEGLRGTVLVCHVDAAETPAEPGEFYDRQLMGLRVLDVAGVDQGRVTAVLHLPAQDLLEVTTPAGTRLVPFVAALVPEVDLSAGFLRVAPVEGLLDDRDDDLS